VLERQGGTDERVVLLLEAASWPLVQEERVEETETAGATGGRRRTTPRLWAMLLLLPPLGAGVDGLPSLLLVVGLAAGCRLQGDL